MSEEEEKKSSACAECGMIVEAGEYHPFAACLMFKAAPSSAIVRGNIFAVRDNGREEIRNRLSALVDKFRDEADTLRLSKSPHAIGGLIVYEDMANAIEKEFLST